MNICFRLESKEVLQVFSKEIIETLYDLVCTEQDNIDFKVRINKVKEKIHCSR